MSLSFDVNQLIAEIQARPVLWDPSNKLYANRDIIRDTWIDIGRIVIPDFDNLKYTKQLNYVQQMKCKYYALRGEYRRGLKWGRSVPYESQLSFLSTILMTKDSNISPSRENSTETCERNVGETQNTRSSNSARGASTTESNYNSLANALHPVLSIAKINIAEVNGATRRGPGRPPKRKSFIEKDVTSLEATNSVVHPQSPIVASDVEPNEDDDAKRCKYQCEVEMASTQENAPSRSTSTYASLSFENGRHSAERRIVPSHNYDTYNDRPHNYDSYNVRAHNYDPYDRSHNYMYIDRPEKERGYSPPSPSPTRRYESYYDSRRYPIIQFPAVPQDDHDDDMAFFRSLLTWTKRFSEDEKLEFRSEVMKLISKMRHESAGNYYVLSQTPLS